MLEEELLVPCIKLFAEIWVGNGDIQGSRRAIPLWNCLEGADVFLILKGFSDPIYSGLVFSIFFYAELDYFLSSLVFIHYLCWSVCIMCDYVSRVLGLGMRVTLFNITVYAWIMGGHTKVLQPTSREVLPLGRDSLGWPTRSALGMTLHL